MGNLGDKEIEIQVQIEHSKKLLKFLESNAKFIGDEHQIDEYFSPKDNDFLKVRPVNEWLRLRNSSDKHSITYKKWHRLSNGVSDYCDEYETIVNDPKQIENIFGALNIKPIVTVDKVRKIYLYKNFEVAIDSIAGLGDFVEIEFKGKIGKNTPTEITNKMIKLLKDLDCGKIYRNHVGYPFQLLFPKEVEVEEV